jgi:hypothetical protein
LKTTYLSGERVYLRGMIDDDKSSTIAWYGSDFPVNEAFGERKLKDLHQSIWDTSTFQLAIVRTDNDTLIGGVLVNFAARDRKASFELQMAPLLDDADDLRAEAIRLVIPWLIEDHNMRRADVMLAGDQETSIATALELGMFEAVRLRGFWRTRQGRVDGLIYQIFNPNEERQHA